MPGFALTVFAGAFLLFEAQPLIGKYILPWFGGGPGVWTTCMLFFQTLLLGGYAYAHFVACRLRLRAQVLAQAALVLAALLLLPITPSDSWKPHGPGNPTLQILVLLAASLGLPYFVLSTTGPLMQHWFARWRPGASPYRLYALSNAGSLLALVSFPFYFEPHFSRRRQAEYWGWGLALYAACFAWTAIKIWRKGNDEPDRTSNGQAPGRASLPASQATQKQSGPGSSPNPHHQAGSSAPNCPVSDFGFRVSAFFRISDFGFRIFNSSRATCHSGKPPSSQLGGSVTISHRLLWLLLPCCASVLLLAVTNKLCQDVAVIPFLWIVPLALYLLSFIICFDSPRWYVRPVFTLGLVTGAAGICWSLFQGTGTSLYQQIVIYSGGLFLCCIACHGEVYRLRPEPRHLTGYYLMIAAGGALGGLFVAVVAPLIFHDFYELHCGLLACAILFAVSLHVSPSPSWCWLACVLTLASLVGLDQGLVWMAPHFKTLSKGGLVALRVGLPAALLLAPAYWVVRGGFRSFARWRLVSCAWLVAGIAVLGVVLWKQGRKSPTDTVFTSRNFYGTLTVYDENKEDPKGHYLLLEHGRITHGLQFVDPEQAAWPTTYYGEQSGVGLAIKALPSRPRRIGLVGLGTGTLTAYLRTGDFGRIYEINPEVERLASSRFSYLSRCPAKVEITFGDARLSMEKEPPQDFDLLVLDAFSSDAIPVHLLTAETFALYQRHLNPDGIIAVHISNHYLDLEPVVVNLARYFGYQLKLIDYDEEEDSWWLYSSTWILLSRNDAILNTPAIQEAAGKIKTMTPKLPLWTDDFVSLYQILK